MLHYVCHRAQFRAARILAGLGGTAWLLVALAAGAAGDASPEPAGEIPLTVGVDGRIELVSIVFRLAGHPEYRRGAVAEYLQAVDRHFEPVKNHAVVKLARQLRNTRGISFDAPMSLAIHLKDAESWEPRVPWDPLPLNLDNRWRPDEARQFVAELKNFARESQFAAFMLQHQATHQTISRQARELLQKEGHLEWFDRFFGARPKAQFRLVPSLVNGPSNYGPQIKTGDTEELYCILGIYRTDPNKAPVIESEVLDTVAHEFCHSYVNPHVYARTDELQKSGPQLFATVQQQMQRMAYGNWQTMLHESIVRASVVRYLDATQGRGAAARQALAEQNRGFRWTQELAQLLEEYEARRDRYPAFGDFMPRIVEFFNGYAARQTGALANPAGPTIQSSNGLLRLNYAIHWPLLHPTNAAPASARPMLEGQLFGVAAGDKLAITLRLARCADEPQRRAWNRGLMFPQHAWMQEVQVWDKDETWIWPNLVYLLKLHGKDRTERYGGWDPGKQVDNDFAAVVIRQYDAAGTHELEASRTAPLVSANWHATGMKNHDRTTVVQEARSDEFVVQLAGPPAAGRLKVWLVFGDFMAHPLPNGWPSEPEFNGGILAFFHLDWQCQPGQPTALSGAWLAPDSATGFDWRRWVARETPDAPVKAEARTRNF